MSEDLTASPRARLAEDAEVIREEIHRALRTARVIDPDDGTVPFYKSDGWCVWTSPNLLIDTIVANVLPLYAHQLAEQADLQRPQYR